MIVRSLFRDPRRACWGLALWLGALVVAIKLRRLVGVDAALAQWMAGARTPALEAAAKGLTFFGSTPWTLLVMAAMSAWWWRRGARRMPAIFWGPWLLGSLLQIALRICVVQWRPDAGPLPASMDPVTRFSLSGFTSGHAFRAAFLYGWWGDDLLGRGTLWAKGAAVGCGLAVLLIGATRVLLGRHWVTDVVGAWLVAALALALARVWRQRVSSEPEAR